MDVYHTVQQFYEDYRGEKRILGRSAEGRFLYAFFVGNGQGAIGISQAAIHAREWITCLLALEQIGRGAAGGVWFLPLVNPDGVAIVEHGLDGVASEERKEFLKGLGTNLALWKANAEGVDLNVNFPAGWGKGRRNLRHAASENYIGSAPLCAPESAALAAFTEQVRPDYTLSWHAKGEEIYWRYFQKGGRKRRDRKYAELLSRATGYPLKTAAGSAGGYKDWCIEHLHIPAFTVEVGSDRLTHPIGRGELEKIVAQCGNAVKDFSEGFV